VKYELALLFTRDNPTPL